MDISDEDSEPGKTVKLRKDVQIPKAHLEAIERYTKQCKFIDRILEQMDDVSSPSLLRYSMAHSAERTEKVLEFLVRHMALREQVGEYMRDVMTQFGFKYEGKPMKGSAKR